MTARQELIENAGRGLWYARRHGHKCDDVSLWLAERLDDLADDHRFTRVADRAEASRTGWTRLVRAVDRQARSLET